MLPRQSTNPKRKSTISQAEAAKILGVTKWHLNHVLRGRRISHSLKRRFQELVSK